MESCLRDSCSQPDFYPSYTICLSCLSCHMPIIFFWIVEVQQLLQNVSDILSEFFKDRICPFNLQIQIFFFSFLGYFHLWYCFVILTGPFIPYSSSAIISLLDLLFFHICQLINNYCSFHFFIIIITITVLNVIFIFIIVKFSLIFPLWVVPAKFFLHLLSYSFFFESLYLPCKISLGVIMLFAISLRPSKLNTFLI